MTDHSPEPPHAVREALTETLIREGWLAKGLSVLLVVAPVALVGPGVVIDWWTGWFTR